MRVFFIIYRKGLKKNNQFTQKMNHERFIGKKIGEFKIKSVIGEGAFSTVCLAETITSQVENQLINTDKKTKKSEIKNRTSKNKLMITKQYAACKIIPRTKVESKKLSSRLDQEIRIHQLMHHQNVVQLIDVHKDELFYYIFLEFCPCGELFQHIIKNKKLEEKEASIFFKQILIGLQYIHSLNVAHRDLKPENILIDQFGRIKIADFGLSKLLNTVKNNGLIKTPCGSPCYASPECISGLPYDGRKSDIWSCGVILYALVTGMLPWTKRTQAKLFEQIKKGKYNVPFYISKNCSDLIHRLMTVDYHNRISIEDALNHPFLKDVKMPHSKLNMKFVSLRKIDRFLGVDDDFEYHKLDELFDKRNTKSDSKIETNFLKVRKGIKSEKDKKKINKIPIQSFVLNIQSESDTEISLESISDEKYCESNKIINHQEDKNEQEISCEKRMQHLPLIIAPRSIGNNKLMLINQFPMNPYLSRKFDQNTTSIVN